MQFIANYVLFQTFQEGFPVYISWIIVSSLPIILIRDYKKTYSINLLSFFIYNFFCYVFLFRYSSEFIKPIFIQLFLNTLFLALTIIIFSISISLLINKIQSIKNKNQEKIRVFEDKPMMICPNCGTKFDSVPSICYNCNAKLSLDEDDKSE